MLLVGVSAYCLWVIQFRAVAGGGDSAPPKSTLIQIRAPLRLLRLAVQLSANRPLPPTHRNRPRPPHAPGAHLDVRPRRPCFLTTPYIRDPYLYGRPLSPFFEGAYGRRATPFLVGSSPSRQSDRRTNRILPLATNPFPTLRRQRRLQMAASSPNRRRIRWPTLPTSLFISLRQNGTEI